MNKSAEPRMKSRSKSRIKKNQDMSKFLSNKQELSQNYQRSCSIPVICMAKDNIPSYNDLPVKRQTIDFTKPNPEPRNSNCSSFVDYKSDMSNLTSLTQNSRRAANATSFAFQSKFNRHQFSNALQEIDSNVQAKNLKAAAPIVMVSPLKQSDIYQFSQYTFNKEKIKKSERYDVMANSNHLDSQGISSTNKSNILSERTPKSYQTPACATSNHSEVKDQVHNFTPEDEKCDTSSFKS